MTATHNGTCQACGRVQAIRANGLLAKHGYTTEYGFFNGTCSGSDHPPLELQTGHNEQVVIRLREWADKQEAVAAGEILEVPVTRRKYINGKTIKTIEALDQAAYEADRSLYGRWEHAVESYRYQLRGSASQARISADELVRLRSEVHGQPVKPRATELPIVREHVSTYREAYARVQALKAEGIDARQRRDNYRGFTITYRKGA
jgi:hypothetical protein